MTRHATQIVNSTSTQEPDLPTFMDHLQELKSRFFWIGIYFMVGSAVTYPFFNHIVHILTAPLGGQKLYYLTPGGGLVFIIKVCMYAGLIAILPVIIYHLYKFIAPVMKKDNARTVLGYTIASSVLAIGGVIFAYAVTLPAAIQFLTNINLDQITSMLTIDSYMSFVIGYIVAGALLFQLPLIMLMINSVTPLPPGKLMNYQRHMIVGSFIVAAIVSPTPDVVNQTILAAPMIVMYQLGIIAVWLRNRRRRPATVPVSASPKVTEPAVSRQYVANELAMVIDSMDAVTPSQKPVLQRSPVTVMVGTTSAYRGRTIDGVRRRHATPVARPLSPPRRSGVRQPARPGQRQLIPTI